MKPPHVNNTKQKSAGEKDVIGKLLWLSIRKVVILKEVWHQKIDLSNDLSSPHEDIRKN